MVELKAIRKQSPTPAFSSSEKDEPFKRIGSLVCRRKKGARLVRGRTSETLNLPREHDAPMRLTSAYILHQGRVGREWRLPAYSALMQEDRKSTRLNSSH